MASAALFDEEVYRFPVRRMNLTRLVEADDFEVLADLFLDYFSGKIAVQTLSRYK